MTLAAVGCRYQPCAVAGITTSTCMDSLRVSKVFPWPIALEWDKTHSSFRREHCSYLASFSGPAQLSVTCSTGEPGNEASSYPCPQPSTTATVASTCVPYEQHWEQCTLPPHPIYHFFLIFRGFGSVFRPASDDSCGGGLGTRL